VARPGGEHTPCPSHCPWLRRAALRWFTRHDYRAGMRADDTVVFVEGESDRRALAVLARRLGLDLAGDGVAVVSLHGITNLRSRLVELEAAGTTRRVLGLYDVGEAPAVARMLAGAQRTPARSPADLEELGFFACTLDLEDELIRAAGHAAVVDVIAARGELDRFRTFQRQPAQRVWSMDAQLRRFAGTASGRKLSFAAGLVEVLPLDRVPRPLTLLLEAARTI
jgi:hypothetical protein